MIIEIGLSKGSKKHTTEMSNSMKDLENSELVLINGGLDGDFAELHGYAAGIALRIAENHFWYIKLVRMVFE